MCNAGNNNSPKEGKELCWVTIHCLALLLSLDLVTKFQSLFIFIIHRVLPVSVPKPTVCWLSVFWHSYMPPAEIQQQAVISQKPTISLTSLSVDSKTDTEWTSDKVCLRDKWCGSNASEAATDPGTATATTTKWSPDTHTQFCIPSGLQVPFVMPRLSSFLCCSSFLVLANAFHLLPSSSANKTKGAFCWFILVVCAFFTWIKSKLNLTSLDKHLFICSATKSTPDPFHVSFNNSSAVLLSCSTLTVLF